MYLIFKNIWTVDEDELLEELDQLTNEDNGAIKDQPSSIPIKLPEVPSDSLIKNDEEEEVFDQLEKMMA